MPVPIDYSGQRFHKLVATRFSGQYSKTSGSNKCRLWFFDCDCGTKDFLCKMEKVKRGDTKSCGCLRKENWNYFGDDAQINEIFVWGKSKIGKPRKGGFKQVNCYSDGNLTFEQFKFLISLPCFYCGKPPSNYKTRRSTGERLYYSGLDRINNSRPHDFDNVLPCCKEHNTMKGSRSTKEYIADLIQQLEYLGYSVKKI